MLLGDELQESFRADAYPTGEQALKVILAKMEMIGDFSQGRLVRGILFEIVDDLLDTSIIIGKLCVCNHAILISIYRR